MVSSATLYISRMVTNGTYVAVLLTTLQLSAKGISIHYTYYVGNTN